MAATGGVKVLGSGISPFTNRVVMALHMKSIEYELVVTRPYDRPELLVQTNPVHKKIPVLIHGDTPVCESLVIVQYIDEEWSTHGPSILPADPYDRAIARFWAAFIDDKLVPLRRQLWMAEGDEFSQSVVEKVCEALVLLEEAFIHCSKGRAFFGGDNPGYLDIALGSLVGWMKVDETMIETKIFDENKIPGLVGWAERLYSDSIVKDVMMDPQMLLEALKKNQAKWKLLLSGKTV